MNASWNASFDAGHVRHVPGYLLYAIVRHHELGEYSGLSGVDGASDPTVVWIPIQPFSPFHNKLNYDGSKVFKSFGIKTFCA